MNMKKTTLLTFFAFLISAMMYSQVPQEFSYQSVIRDNTGKLMVNKDLSVNVSITKNGSSAYSESHSVKTSSNGLISLNVGSKNPSSFSNIDWANGSYNIEVTISDSNGLTINTESKLLSVPYALFSKKSADTPELIASIAAVQSDVDKNEADSDSADTILTTDLATEVTRAKAAEAALQTDVDGNEADADAAIAALQTDVDGNEADADAAIACLLYTSPSPRD